MAGTIVDHEDPAWSFYALFKLASSQTETEVPVCFVGFVSVYRMFAYPDKLKQRVCQFLVLPPFQRQVRIVGTDLLLTSVAFELHRASN
jgi:histone acetyltransferase 1